jgi:hypothetical protein
MPLHDPPMFLSKARKNAQYPEAFTRKPFLAMYQLYEFTKKLSETP